MLVKHVVNKGLLLRNAGALTRAYHGIDAKATMNDLPVPQGDWKEQYTQQNTKYNAILATGIIALVSTIAFVKSTGVIEFNFSPPKSLD